VQPASQLVGELGLVIVSATEDVLGPSGARRRETNFEVVLIPRLPAALEQLNPVLAGDAINSASMSLRDRLAMSLAAANREIWELLRDGVKVSVPDREHGGLKAEKDAGAVTEEVE